VVVAGMGLLAAPAAMATGGSCSFTLSFSAEGPCAVDKDDTQGPDCSRPGGYTGIKYTNTGSSLDHAATLVTRNNTSIFPVSPTGSQVYTECTGDPVSGLGKYSCHQKAVKINGIPAGQSFWIIVPGQKAAIETSLAGKRNCSGVKSIPIIGLGLDAPAAPVTETLQHGVCAVEFTMNALTGTVQGAKLTPASLDLGCESPDMKDDGTLNGSPVENLELVLNGVSLGNSNFGSGYVNSGAASCTTRVVGGKVYTFGKPCP
jgi:hypothetical protein